MFYRHDTLSVITITRAIQGSNVNTISGYLEERGVQMRHDSYTQDIYIWSSSGFSNAYAWFHFRFISFEQYSNLEMRTVDHCNILLNIYMIVQHSILSAVNFREVIR